MAGFMLKRIPAPKRRWFAFSLRILFVVVTVFACWLGYEWNWIRQRHEILARCLSASRSWNDSDPPTRAPHFLWLFGEAGYADIFLLFESDSQRELTAAEHDEVRRASEFFPEAQRILGIVSWPPDPPSATWDQSPLAP